MAAPSLRALGTVVTGNTTAPSFAAPAGAVSTDVILVGTFIDDGRTTVTGVPTGFTLAPNLPQINDATAGAPSHGLYVYWGRFADVGAGPYTFTLTNSFGAPFVEGRTAAIQGCITSGSPWDATNGATSGNTSVTTAPAVSATSTSADRYAFYAATNWTGGAWTPATGFTEQWDANDEIITFDDLALPTAQTVSPQATCVGNNRSNAWVGILLPVATAQPNPLPPRTVQTRDPGEAWWIQRDRRDANTVGTAANPLPSPLDSAWQGGARYWHPYGDTAGAAPRTWQSLQRQYISDPSLLAPASVTIPPPAARTAPVRDPGETWWQQRPGRDPSLLGTALLENELLGGAGTAQRYLTPVSNAARWWMPQQPLRVGTTPGLLDQAQLETPLLGGADGAKRYAQPATHADRRQVPQQRAYVSDPLLLATALLEAPLLVDAGLVRRLGAYGDRRSTPGQRWYPDLGFLAAPSADPLALGTHLRRLAAAYWRSASTGRTAPGWPVPPAAVVVVAPGFQSLTTATASTTLATGGPSAAAATSSATGTLGTSTGTATLGTATATGTDSTFGGGM